MFHKYHGTGNDFIMIDNRTSKYEDMLKSPEKLQKLCDRKLGVGADGINEIKTANGYDFEMLYYNSDGILGNMCGNGARCCLKFVKEIGLVSKTDVHFLANDGEHFGRYITEDGEDESYAVKMKDVCEVIEYDDHSYFIDTGAPHHVTFVSDLRTYDVHTEGNRKFPTI